MKTMSAENLVSLKLGRGEQICNLIPHITVISKIFSTKLPIKEIDRKDAHSSNGKTGFQMTLENLFKKNKKNFKIWVLASKFLIFK